MRALSLIVALVVVACQSTSTTTSAEISCPVPGAVPNDGVDDRAAIQSALGLGCARLDPGVYDIVTPSRPTGGRRDYAMLTVIGSVLTGSGPGTTLRFTGDAGLQDWYGVLLGTRGVVSDLRLDTSELYDTSEQTHAIRITGPTESPLVARVTCDHPRRGMPGGDCVQIVGYPGREVVGAHVIDSVFEHADRSAVGVHSGALDLQVTGCSFLDTGDVHVNFEGDGDITDVLIADNVFGGSAQSDYAVELDSAARVRLTRNTMTSGGVLIFDSTDVEVDHSTITRTSLGASGGVVEVQKGSARVSLHDLTIERTPSATPGPVVRALQRDLGSPSGISVERVALVQRTAASVVSATGAGDLLVSDSSLTYSGVGPAYGVDVAGSSTIPAGPLIVRSCSFSGPLGAAVRVSGSRAGAGEVDAELNTSNGPRQGLRCETPRGISGPISLVGNTWAPSVCPGAIER